MTLQLALLIVLAAVAAFVAYKLLAKCLEWFGRKMAEPPPPPLLEGVEVVRDIEFTSTPDGPLLLDIYKPADASPSAPLPVVLYLFGGGWQAGNRHQLQGLRGQDYAQHGYAVVSIEYRHSHVAIFPAQIHDCKAAVRWIRQNAAEYGLDGSRIAAFGGSAGGHLSALLGTSGAVADIEGDLPPQGDDYAGPIQAVVDLFGPTDLSRIAEQTHRFGTRHEAKGSVVSKFLGGRPSLNLEQAKAANPITYIRPSMPPFLIIHGSADWISPVQQSEMLHQALLDQGNESELHVIEGAGHVSIKSFASDEIFNKIRGFLDKHLKS